MERQESLAVSGSQCQQSTTYLLARLAAEQVGLRLTQIRCVRAKTRRSSCAPPIPGRSARHLDPGMERFQACESTEG